MDWSRKSPLAACCLPGAVTTLMARVGDVFQEDQSEHDVLVLARVHIVAQRIGGGPELGLETEIRAIFAPWASLSFPIQ
jgi:hypothetical protein